MCDNGLCNLCGDKEDNSSIKSNFLGLSIGTISFRIGPLGDITEKINKVFEDGINRIELIGTQHSKHMERN
jgi:hypothetical protein